MLKKYQIPQTLEREIDYEAFYNNDQVQEREEEEKLPEYYMSEKEQRFY